jgi:hypothetical protein
MTECNKSFSRLLSERNSENLDQLNSAEGRLQLVLAAAFSAVPIFAGAAGLVDDLAKEGAQLVWSVASGAAGVSVSSLMEGTSLGGVTSNVAGTLTESTVTAVLTRMIVARLGASAAVAVLPLLPEIALAVAAFIIAAVVAHVTKVFIEATELYLNQPDQIFEIANAGPADGTVTYGGETNPIPDGIRDGVDVKNLVAFPNVEGPNSDMKVDLSGQSNGALYQLDLHCADVLRLSELSDSLDTSEVDLTNFQSWRFLDDQFIIDMAGGVDTVKYATTRIPGISEIDAGIFWFDGETHAAGGGFSGLQNSIGALGTTAMLELLNTESLLPDDDLIVKGQENVVLTNENDRFAFTGQDYTVHSGYGLIEGKGGGDIIAFAGAKSGPGGLNLTLDGGTGNDWIYASGGEKAVTAGGLGRDWIFNTSKDGEIWCYGDSAFNYQSLRVFV